MSRTVEQIMQEYEAAWMASLEFYSDQDGKLTYKVNAEVFREQFPYIFKPIENITLADLRGLAENTIE